jgi:hypothetical protein
MNHTSSANFFVLGTAVATSAASLQANSIIPIKDSILKSGITIIEQQTSIPRDEKIVFIHSKKEDSTDNQKPGK